MAGVAQGILALLIIYLFPCSCFPRTWTNSPPTRRFYVTKRPLVSSRPRTTWKPSQTTEDEYGDEYGDRKEDKCPYNSYYPLYDEVSSVAKTVLHPDYDLLYLNLFMHSDNEDIQVRFKDIKANLEVTPITMFSNLSLSRFQNGRYGSREAIQSKLGELISEKVVQAYSNFVNNSVRATPTDLSKIEPFSYDESKWKSPWLKESLISGLVYVANTLEGLVGKQLTDEGKALLKSKNIDKILQVTGELANNAIHSNLNLNNLKYFKQSILMELQRYPQKLSEKNINNAVDCWYSTDGFYHIEEGSEEKILLLQAMIEVIPKDRLKEVFRSWSKSLQKQNDLEVGIDKILVVVDQKIQEFDIPRMINLFKVRMESLIENMKSENVGGKNLFQRVETLSKMMEKAMWRIRSGLWPEMINFLDRMVLSIKNNGNGKSKFWNKLDNLLSPTYHQLKGQYKATLLKELFPGSKKQIGYSTLLNHPYFRHLEGKLYPFLHDLLVRTQYHILPEALNYVKKMKVVEWEKWLKERLYWFIQDNIRSSLLRGGNSEEAKWLLKYTLAEMNDAGFTQLFFQEWEVDVNYDEGIRFEGIPRDLEDFLEMDWESYFVYTVHAILTT